MFEKVKSVPKTCQSLTEDEWYKRYIEMAQGNYAKPYPRPFPCGTLVLGFDRRRAELLGHHRDIAMGMCGTRLLFKGRPVTLQVFVEMTADRLWIRTVDEEGHPAPDLFNRVRLIPDPDTPKDLPPFEVPDPMPEATLSFSQILPFLEPSEDGTFRRHSKDRAFRLTARLNNALEVRTRTNTWSGIPETIGPLERGIRPVQEFVACVQLHEGLAAAVAESRSPNRRLGNRTRRAADRIGNESGGTNWIA